VISVDLKFAATATRNGVASLVALNKAAMHANSNTPMGTRTK